MKRKELKTWEEVRGKIQEIKKDDGFIFILLTFSYEIKIPYEEDIENNLKSLIGKEVGILHTDIKRKEYIIREVKDEL